MSTSIPSPTAVIAIVFLGLACGGSAESETRSAASLPPAAKAAAKSIDVCSLLTAEEIAAVTGAKVADIKPDAYGTVGTCNFTVAGQLMPVVSVLLAPAMPNVSSSSEMAQWRSKQAKAGTAYGDIKFIIEPIEGLGVPAIRNEIEGAGMVTVETAAKGRLLDVTTSSLERSKALVAKAIARLL